MSQAVATLDERHLNMLTEESAISPEIIAARGYRTIYQPSELELYGFSKSQRRAPGLLLPVHPTDGGDPLLYIYRPDSPRIRTNKAGDRKVLKYEIPSGASIRVDCPPVCQPRLKDPSIVLWITEGQKKADALASQGACALALLGVWNWRGTNEQGGVTFLVDWDHVALNGRDVRLVFDSNTMIKAQALDHLTEQLEQEVTQITAARPSDVPD